MTALDPALDAELSKDRATIFGAVRIEFPDHAVHLLDGSGAVSFDGMTFTGEDPVFGVLEAIEDFSDGTGDEAPGIGISLLPSSTATAVELASEDMQGSPVSVWLGAQNRATGAVIGAPYLLFYGEIDIARLLLGKGSRRVEYECVGGMERLFMNDEGIRLAGTWHKQVWPGELGLDHVTGVDDSFYWGAKTPAGGVS